MHIALMVWDCCIAIRAWVEPDLMTARGLSVKFKAEGLENSNDIAVTKTGEATHFIPR